MTISADLMQIAIAEESTYGVASTTIGDWHVLPITDESLAANVEVSLSNLLNDKRQVLDSILNGVTAEGDVNAEMVICPALEIMLESAMAKVKAVNGSPPSGDPASLEELTIGDVVKSFTIQKRTKNPLFGQPSEPQYFYQYVTGAVVNVMAISTTPGEPVTYSMSLLGKDFLEGNSDDAAYPIAAGEPTAPSNINVLRAADVMTLKFGTGTLDDATPLARCFGEFTQTLNNNYRGLRCIGTLGNKNVTLGRCEIELSGMIYFKDNSILKELLAQGENDVTYRIETGDGPPITVFTDMFQAFYPRTKIAANPVVAGGTSTDMVNDVTINALYDETDDTTLKLSWGSGAVTV